MPYSTYLEIQKEFLSTPSARRATVALGADVRDLNISIHALREEGDPAYSKLRQNPKSDFYPRPPRGGRRAQQSTGCTERYFYPRPPRGGRRIIAQFLSFPEKFLSTPSARRATLCALDQLADQGISIHALREEGDRRRGTTRTWCRAISIHALREEGDNVYWQLCCYPLYFYPRPPRGGRLNPTNLAAFADRISIHALREEGDQGAEIRGSGPFEFLSTPSARRATPVMVLVS